MLHPLDVVKTRLQGGCAAVPPPPACQVKLPDGPPTSPSVPAVQDGAGMLPAYRGTLDALRQIVRQEGWRALYSGRPAPLTHAPPLSHQELNCLAGGPRLQV